MMNDIDSLPRLTHDAGHLMIFAHHFLEDLMYKNRPLAMFTTLVFLVTMTSGNANVAHARLEQGVQHADHGQSFLGSLFRFVQENPFKALAVGAVTLFAGYASFKIFKNHLRVEAAAPAAAFGGAAARGLGAPAQGGAGNRAAPDIRGGRDAAQPSMLDVDHNFERALLASKKEHEFRQRHQMRPVDYTFNIDVFRQLERISDTSERVLFLQALLYDLEQRFIDRQLLEAFVESARGLDVEAAIDAFQQLAREGWSLLQLALELGELNPHGDMPMLDFRALRMQFARLRMRLAAGASIDDLRFDVAKGCRNPFDHTLLDLLIRYLWELAGNEPVPGSPITPQTHERVRLAMENLFGEAFTPLLHIEALIHNPAGGVAGSPPMPSADQLLPAIEEEAVVPPPKELPVDELRRRRLNLFDKKDKADD